MLCDPEIKCYVPVCPPQHLSEFTLHKTNTQKFGQICWIDDERKKETSLYSHSKRPKAADMNFSLTTLLTILPINSIFLVHSPFWNNPFFYPPRTHISKSYFSCKIQINAATSYSSLSREPARDLIPGPGDHHLSRRQMLNNWANQAPLYTFF